MDLFDIIGPVMIGPSSSHTAGAARIGRTALSLLDERCVKADIFFHGSFATTYQGHGTDRAIAGGLMGMEVDDPRIRQSLVLAKEEGIQISFATIRLKNAHPNTAVLKLTGESAKRMTVRASSTGGGGIRIDEVDGLLVDIRGQSDTLVIKHRDAPGVIAAVTNVLAKAGMNIGALKDARAAQGGAAIMAVETDSPPDSDILSALKNVGEVQSVTFLKRRPL